MFEKGKSGNPGGRPKDPIITQVRALALDACPRAIKKLIEIMDSGENKYALQAANSILDRGIGRAIAQNTDDADRPATLADLQRLLAEVERNVDQPL